MMRSLHLSAAFPGVFPAAASVISPGADQLPDFSSV